MDWVFAISHPKILYTNAAISLGFLIPSILHVAICFILLGICASDYLCPNVAKLADSNGYGTGTLTAVLLSWCNSSPDLFSNFMSWITPSNYGSDNGSSSAASLSIGEVVGACGIIMCVVIGSIFIIMASVNIELTDAQRHSFIRDLGFTLIAIGLLYYVCFENTITVLNCCLMITIYLIYLIVQFRYKPFGSGPLVDALELNSNQLSEEVLIEEDAGSHMKRNIISAMDFNSLLTMLENSESNSRGENELENLVMSPLVPKRPLTEPIIREPYSDTFAARVVPQSSPGAFGPYYDDPDRAIQEESRIEEQPSMTNRAMVRRKGRFKRLRSGLFQLFLPHLVDLKKKSVFDAILSLLTAPFVMLLRLSCPQPFEIMEFNDFSGQYVFTSIEITLLFLQAVLCPHFSLLVLSCLVGCKLPIPYWILAMASSVGLTALMLQLYRSVLLHNRFSLLQPTLLEQENALKGRRIVEKLENATIFIFTVIGIINSILWISLIANSVIELMELYQKITHISQSILGLTIFAWGNSISDLISNIAMCKLYRKVPHGDNNNIDEVATKFFMISCTSCLGGVMLNSMGGIGISALIAMLFILDGQGKWWFERYVELHPRGEIDYKFVISCIALVVQTFLLLLVFGSPSSTREWFKERMRPLGIIMCCIWGIVTLCNVLLESL